MLYFTVHDTMVHSDKLQSTSVHGPLLSTVQSGQLSTLVDQKKNIFLTQFVKFGVVFVVFVLFAL